MRLSPKGADKITYTALYLVVTVIAVWGGGKIINYAADFGFYRDFLMPWEVRLLEMRHRSLQIPDFRRGHPMDHMSTIVEVMKANGMSLPNSNTEHAFVYRLHRFGGEKSNILLVFNGRRIVIYGLPAATFKRVDHFVDGRVGADQGEFTGYLSKDRLTYIGAWKI